MPVAACKRVAHKLITTAPSEVLEVKCSKMTLYSHNKIKSKRQENLQQTIDFLYLGEN